MGERERERAEWGKKPKEFLMMTKWRGEQDGDPVFPGTTTKRGGEGERGTFCALSESLSLKRPEEESDMVRWGYIETRK